MDSDGSLWHYRWMKRRRMSNVGVYSLVKQPDTHRNLALRVQLGLLFDPDPPRDRREMCLRVSRRKLPDPQDQLMPTDLRSVPTTG